MEANILELLFELKKKCVAHDGVHMSETNLTQAEYHFFIAIKSCDEINSNIIAEKMDLSLSRISRVIDKLVKKKLITRKIDNKDRRAIKLDLTAEGKAIKEEIEAYRKECEYKISKNVSAEEIDTIKKSFNTILNLL